MRKLEVSYNLCSADNNAVLLDMVATVQGKLIFKIGCQIKWTKELISGTISISPRLSVDTYTYDDFTIDSNDARFNTLAHEFVITQDFVYL